MKIVLNGAWREIDGRLARGGDAVSEAGGHDALDARAANLETVLMQLGFGNAVVATAVNGEFVPVAARAELRVRDGDRVEVLAPMQGG